MGKILCFVYDDMADFELTLAANAVTWIKKEVITIGNDLSTKKARANVWYQPQMTISDAIHLEDVDGLIIPGGWNHDLSEELKQLIQKLNDEHKLLAAICAGPIYLAKANVLHDKKYTTTLTENKKIKPEYAQYFNEENYVVTNVVRDKNIITAIGRSFVDFAMEILDYFNAFKDEETKTKYANYYKGL